MHIAVDLDGTLAEYNGWKGENHIGKPVPEILKKLKEHLSSGGQASIFTARVSEGGDKAALARHVISAWLKQAGLPDDLEITALKQKRFKEFWDDRAVPIERNAGQNKLSADNVVNYLQDSIETRKGRSKEYGEAYKQHGHVVNALFPNGVDLITPEDFNRFGCFCAIIGKCVRYANNFSKGGHEDSMRDISVYAAMARELDELIKEEKQK